MSRQLIAVLSIVFCANSATAKDDLLSNIHYPYSFYRQTMTGEKHGEWVSSTSKVDNEMGPFSIYERKLIDRTSLEAFAVRNIDTKSDATRLELRLKYQITDSLYISGGLARRNYQYEMFDRLHTWGDIGSSFSIGNQWKFKKGWTFGIDWVRAYFPMMSFENGRSSNKEKEAVYCFFCLSVTYIF